MNVNLHFFIYSVKTLAIKAAKANLLRATNCAMFVYLL